MFETGQFLRVVDLEPTRVFAAAVVDTTVFIFRKGKSDALVVIERGNAAHEISQRLLCDQATWSNSEESVINLHADPRELDLLTKLESSGDIFDSVVEYSQGIIPYKTKEDGAANKYIAPERRGDDWFPLVESARQMTRYGPSQTEAFLHYGRWLWCARDNRFFDRPKILFHRLRKKLPRQLVGTLVDANIYNRHSLSNLILRDGMPDHMLKAVLGLFNSTLLNWWFVKRFGLLMEVGGFKISRAPLPKWTDQSRVVSLVDTMLSLHKRLAAEQLPQRREQIQREIDATDRQIDQLVYQLYGLTDDEIRIVELGQ